MGGGLKDVALMTIDFTSLAYKQSNKHETITIQIPFT